MTPAKRPSTRARQTPIQSLDDLQPDPLNANRGTDRGREALRRSLHTYGAGRSIVIDKRGRILGGHKTVEQAKHLGLPITVVPTTGQELVVVQRVDLDARTDPRAQELALADNRVAELDLDWDPAVLRQLEQAGVALEAFWTPKEFARLLAPEGPEAQLDEHTVLAPRAAGQVPPAWLASAPTFTKTTLAWGNMIQALTASQTAVRGAHPTRLLLDEIDEMKLPILEAAQGQPMDRDGVRAQTVMSSTHQHPDGTVTAMRRRAADLGWPVYEWCYRETLKPHGWLTADQVVRKQAELSRTMWAVEYELQEPSAEGRAIDPPAVERMFDATLGTHIPAGDLEHTWRGQPGPPAERAWPDPAGAWYCIGVDWAQKRHYTVAVVVRCDTTPLQVVAVYRIQRRPWPEMTERVGALLDEFPGPAVHDATGAGSAIGEFPALEAHRQLQGVTMVGRDRVDLFRNDITAIERDEIVCPRIDVFYTEHLYCGEDNLFGSGHPPDTVVAMALAYHAFKTGRRPGDYGVTI